jgi:hypothetical protein
MDLREGLVQFSELGPAIQFEFRKWVINTGFAASACRSIADKKSHVEAGPMGQEQT